MPFIEVTTEGSAELETFTNSVIDHLRSDPKEGFWKCKAAFRTLLETPFLKAVGDGFMKEMLSKPERPAAQWQVDHLPLIQNPQFGLNVSWALEAIPHESTIPSHGAHVMMCLLGQEGAVADMYALPDVDLEVFEKGASLTYSHQMALPPGEIVEIDGGDWAADIQPKAGTCMIMFVTAPLWTQIWSFDRISKVAFSVSASSQEITQIKETLGILRRFKHRDAASTVARLCTHPCHDIRWEAIKTLGVLDAPMAVERLLVAKSDPHPHVRAAATRMLSTIEAQ